MQARRVSTPQARPPGHPRGRGGASPKLPQTKENPKMTDAGLHPDFSFERWASCSVCKSAVSGSTSFLASQHTNSPAQRPKPQDLSKIFLLLFRVSSDACRLQQGKRVPLIKRQTEAANMTAADGNGHQVTRPEKEKILKLNC